MPPSPEQQSKHRLGYVEPVICIVFGVAVLVLYPAFVIGQSWGFIGQDWSVKAGPLLIVLGLALLGWGAFTLWRHSKVDPTETTDMFEDLRSGQQARALRRTMWAVFLFLTPVAALAAFKLVQVQYGWERGVEVWMPVALLYNKLGFWPAVLFLPAAGLLIILALAWRTRSIGHSNRPQPGPAEPAA